MNQELFIIDLLSTQKQLIKATQPMVKRNLLLVSCYFLVTGLFFFGIATIVYSFLLYRIHSAVLIQRLRHLYFFSFFLGGSLMLFFLIIAGLLIYRHYQLIHSFHYWLEKQVPIFLRFQSLSQDKQAYYLAKDPQHFPKLRMKKTDCSYLTTALDGYPIYFGYFSRSLGINQLVLFALKKEPPYLDNHQMQHGLRKQPLTICLFCLGLFGVAGAYFYAVRPITQNEVAQLSDSIQTSQSTSLPETATNDQHLLTTQKGATPKKQTTSSYEFYLDKTSNELFMTTTNGNQWSFVPLKPDWLRFGSYILTSGELPLGYWMDKSYELSAHFSWFIYSPTTDTEKDIYFLSSTDSGKTWQSHIITQKMARIRYRKATMFSDGSGILTFSQETTMSSEVISFFVTTDFGKTWHKGGTTTINQPIQNSSFLNPTLGFVATRNQLYYTTNGGDTFKEALITIPTDYQKNSLDIFQSPNEVTQTDSTTLETKFYLLKNDGIDIGKMFACLYQSTDHGETWQFVRQLSQVTIND